MFISELVFVWVPATTGKSKVIHEYAAGFVGLVMLAAPLILLFDGNLASIAALGVIIYVIISLLICLLLLIPRFRRKYVLACEVVFCIAFWALISLIAHS